MCCITSHCAVLPGSWSHLRSPFLALSTLVSGLIRQIVQITIFKGVKGDDDAEISSDQGRSQQCGECLDLSSLWPEKGVFCIFCYKIKNNDVRIKFNDAHAPMKTTCGNDILSDHYYYAYDFRIAEWVAATYSHAFQFPQLIVTSEPDKAIVELMTFGNTTRVTQQCEIPSRLFGFSLSHGPISSFDTKPGNVLGVANCCNADPRPSDTGLSYQLDVGNDLMVIKYHNDTLISCDKNDNVVSAVFRPVKARTTRK